MSIFADNAFNALSNEGFEYSLAFTGIVEDDSFECHDQDYLRYLYTPNPSNPLVGRLTLLEELEEGEEEFIDDVTLTLKSKSNLNPAAKEFVPKTPQIPPKIPNWQIRDANYHENPLEKLLSKNKDPHEYPFIVSFDFECKNAYKKFNRALNIKLNSPKDFVISLDHDIAFIDFKDRSKIRSYMNKVSQEFDAEDWKWEVIYSKTDKDVPEFDCDNCGVNPIAKEVKCGFHNWCEECDNSLYSTKAQ